MKLTPSEIKTQELTAETELDIDREQPVKELTEVVKNLTDKVSWIKNIEIQNKKEQKERFKQARENGENFNPDFNFRKLENPEDILQLINQAEQLCEEVDEEDMSRYGAEKLSAEDIQRFFQDIFRELRLYTRLSAEIEEEKSWRKYSEKIWPMVDKEQYQESLKKLKEMNPENEGLEKNLDSRDLKEMFEQEIERLGMEYDTEIRSVGGCFNIPEERKVIVADGNDEKRIYSREEAEMLTKHELFHAVRAFNGYQTGKESDFPPILGIHTPFYDKTEEGGALHREIQTGVRYADKDFDYHFRLVAAYKIAKDEDYKESFQDIVEELIELGGSVDRSFYLVARNREALRHHIYLKGVSDWKNRDEIWPLLIGKVNPEYAKMFREEVEADGMLSEPEVSEERIF